MNIVKTTPPNTPSKPGRLVSLDALRGFDMFWIVSGEEIFHGFADVVQQKYHLYRNPTNWQLATDGRLSFLERMAVGMSNQLHHTVWNGFTFYDLIFPLFIFIAGISMPFSYNRGLDTEMTGQLNKSRSRYFQLIRRTVLLLLLGMVVNGALSFAGYEHTRFASVLGRIALSCFFAAVIYLNFNLRGQIIWFVSILLGYWALMALVPVPGHGAGVLTPDGNLAAFIDQHLLPGKLHRKVYDPEGLLSTIPAICSALLGVFTGSFLLPGRVGLRPVQKMLALFGAGLVLVLLGLLWNISFPINKNMWTSSFTLYAGGWSMLLFAAFYGIIDVAGFKAWCRPFVWIGVNSILIYMAAHGLVNFLSTSQFVLDGAIKGIDPIWHRSILWTGVLLIQLLLLRFLYQRKIFLKL
ncbi:putative acyltransferase [Mucilaginibacter yixingensis]|uniref:Putative acyltransferase n=1 Tax=Mucilaginibacter yixingensis TaxID=1295612 RepID=A0A2T5JFF3_9SPHI|nr:putative acyltransferase [Mucilaginibacter yixingensis]